jgi:hypothetical protein
MTIRRRCTERTCKNARRCLEHLRFDVSSTMSAQLQLRPDAHCDSYVAVDRDTTLL